MTDHALDAPADPPVRKRHWLWPTRFRVIGGLLIALAIWGWFDVRKRGTFDINDPYIHKTDFTVYTEAGSAFFDGRDPYKVTNRRGWTYLYPPMFAIVVAPLHELDTRNQVLVWFGISVLVFWGCYKELMRIAQRVMPAGRMGHFGRIPTWLGTLAFAAATLPTLNCLQRGQVGIAKLYLLLLGFRLIVENRSMLRTATGGSMLAMAATLKITPIVPALVVVGQQTLTAWYEGTERSWHQAEASSLGLVGGLALWVLLVPAAIVGWQANLGHLETWWNGVAVHAESIDDGDIAGDSRTFRNQSLSNAAFRFGNWVHYYFAAGPPDYEPGAMMQPGPGLIMDKAWIEQALFAVRALAGCLMLAVAARMAKYRDPLGSAAAFGISCAATLIIFTIARGHYFMLLMPANIFVPLWLFKAGRSKWAWSIAIIPAVLIIGHYVALEYAGRIGLLGIGTAFWYFSTCVVLLRSKPVAVTATTSTTPGHLIDKSLQRPLAA